LHLTTDFVKEGTFTCNRCMIRWINFYNFWETSYDIWEIPCQISQNKGRLLCVFYCFLILCTHWASGETNYFEAGAFMLLLKIFNLKVFICGQNCSMIDFLNTVSVEWFRKIDSVRALFKANIICSTPVHKTL
jgi:hypothetical protein